MSRTHAGTACGGGVARGGGVVCVGVWYVWGVVYGGAWFVEGRGMWGRGLWRGVVYGGGVVCGVRVEGRGMYATDNQLM